MTATAVSMAIPELLVRRAEAEPDAVAFRVAGEPRLGDWELRFGDWEARSRAAAHALAGAKVGPGTRVGLLFAGSGWIDYAVAYLGVLRAGGTALHLNDRLPAAEADRRLAACRVSHLVHADRLAPPAGFTGDALPASTLRRLDGRPPEVPIRPEDVADVHYTSGTTGPAKAYLVPHGNITFGRDAATMRNFTAGGQLLVPMEPGSGSAASCVLSTLTSPMTTVLSASDDPERLAGLVQRLRITAMAITPWIAGRLVAARVHERYDLSTLQMLACASAPLPPPVAIALRAMLPGARLTGAFSQSEASPALLVSVFDPDKPLAVGRPNATTELRIVDGAGRPVPHGELGEIWLRHPAPRRLYLDPALNADILADGWYRTGDYGRIGPDGDLFLFDRGADLIRTAGTLVSSIEVEAVLYEHPAVREAAVVGTPAGVLAAVVLSDPAELPGVRALTQRRLAAHQVPARYLPLDALPRNDKGKVLKRELRALAG